MQQSTAPMLNGSISRCIIRFALPLFLGNLFQQLYNTADALIVGNLLGDNALAAVSSTGSLIFLLVGFFQGLSNGAGVLIARYCGAGNREKTRLTIHTDLALGLVISAVLTLTGVLGTPMLLRWMGTPDSVFPQAAAYLKIYFAGSLGLVMYNVCMGIMQALGDSRHPLYYLIFSALVNVPLDILFIAGLGMDVEGAAFATVFAQLLSAALCLYRLTHREPVYTVKLRRLCLDAATLRRIVRYGLPAGLQNSVISIANVVVQSQINYFGAMAMSGCGAYTKLEGFAFLPVTSFTAALTTFVGQNLGGCRPERAKKGARFGILCSLSMAELIGALFFLSARPLIAAFCDSPEAIAFGVQKMRTCSLFYCLLAATHCMSAVQQGAGRAIVPMLTTMSIWCVFRVVFLWITVPLTGTIDVVNWVYPLTWSMSTAVLAVVTLRSDWVHAFSREVAVGE